MPALPTDSARIANAIAALVDAVANHFEIKPELIEGFAEELTAEIESTLNQHTSCISPEMCAGDDSALTPPPGDFDGFDASDDDTNAWGFYGTYTSDAGGL